jgi:uncharacterized protein YyaL (SSP411 family)
MYDLVEGGFCRYSVDEKWFVPHFEKMLYDNALLCGVYTKAYLRYNTQAYLDTARACGDFWIHFMSEDDLFFSASDADTDGKEGLYYTYTYEEVLDILQNSSLEHPQQKCAMMGVTQEGNFEERNIIRFEDGEIPQWFATIKPQLIALRQQRTQPFVDRKIQTSWSAMMLTSLFELGAIDTHYLNQAQKSLDALLRVMFVDDILYHTTLIHKTPKVEAFLEDYAFLAQTLLTAFKYTQDEMHLILAQRFVNKALEEFYDKGAWNFSHGEIEVKAEVTDNTYTSPVSVMVENMLQLSFLLEDEKYSHFAFKTLEYNSYNLGRKPIYYPKLLIQALRYLKGQKVIKTSQTNIKNHSFELAKLSYPFILLKASDTQEYMICGQNSCFANTQDIQELETLLEVKQK